MEWTTSKPTKAGFYWKKDKNNIDRIVEVWASEYDDDVYFSVCGSEELLQVDDGQWAGPLEPPR